MLHQQETDPEKKATLGDIALSAQTLLDYFNGILYRLHLEAQTAVLCEPRFSLSALIEKLITVQKLLALQKNLPLTVEIDPQLPPLLIGGCRSDHAIAPQSDQ